MLILGSLPGESSLAAGRYYAHPQNRFWHLVGGVIGTDLVALDYEERLATLKAHRIGLWDSIQSARRQGSLDAAMRDIEPTALPDLVATLPDLRAVAFNGAASAKFGMRQLEGIELDLLSLPSSSPAYAAMPLIEKERRWARIGDYLS